jgi:hypothetical protein
MYANIHMRPIFSEVWQVCIKVIPRQFRYIWSVLRLVGWRCNLGYTRKKTDFTLADGTDCFDWGFSWFLHVLHAKLLDQATIASFHHPTIPSKSRVLQRKFRSTEQDLSSGLIAVCQTPSLIRSPKFEWVSGLCSEPVSSNQHLICYVFGQILIWATFSPAPYILHARPSHHYPSTILWKSNTVSKHYHWIRSTASSVHSSPTHYVAMKNSSWRHVSCQGTLFHCPTLWHAEVCSQQSAVRELLTEGNCAVTQAGIQQSLKYVFPHQLKQTYLF